MLRRSSLVAFVAGALIAGAIASTGTPLWRSAHAEDPPGNDPLDGTTPGRTINPTTGSLARGTPVTHTASEGSNSRAIAIATQAAGENVVFYFDTELQRMLVYQYVPGDRGGSGSAPPGTSTTT